MTATAGAINNSTPDQMRPAGGTGSSRKDEAQDGTAAAFDALFRIFASAVAPLPDLGHSARPSGAAAPADRSDEIDAPLPEGDQSNEAGRPVGERLPTTAGLRLTACAGEAARGELSIGSHADPTRAAAERLRSGGSNADPLASAVESEDVPQSDKTSTRPRPVATNEADPVVPRTGGLSDDAPVSRDAAPNPTVPQVRGDAMQQQAGGEQRGGDQSRQMRGSPQQQAGIATPKPVTAAAEPATVRLSVGPTGKLQSSSGGQGTPGVAAVGGSKANDPLRLIKPPPASLPAKEPIESQVARALGNAIQRKDGVAQLRLTPEHLGEVRVEVRVKDGIVAARLDVTTDQARALLSDSLHELRSALEARGLHVDKVEVRHVTDDRQHATDGARPDNTDTAADAGVSRDGSDGSPWMGRPGSGAAGGAGGSEDRGIDAAEPARDTRDGLVDGPEPAGLAWDAESSMWRAGVDAVV